MEIKGELYFSDHEPRIFGHLQIAGEHFEIKGHKHSEIRTSLTGRRVRRKTTQTQMDMFDENPSGTGD
jgi:hypothetical protein